MNATTKICLKLQVSVMGYWATTIYPTLYIWKLMLAFQNHLFCWCTTERRLHYRFHTQGSRYLESAIEVLKSVCRCTMYIHDAIKVYKCWCSYPRTAPVGQGRYRAGTSKHHQDVLAPENESSCCGTFLAAGSPPQTSGPQDRPLSPWAGGTCQSSCRWVTALYRRENKWSYLDWGQLVYLPG